MWNQTDKAQAPENGLENPVGEDDSGLQSHGLARPSTRYQCLAIDLTVCLLLFVLAIITTKALGLDHQLSRYFIFGIPLFYFVIADALPEGQSLGKRILGLAVVSKKTGKSCNIVQSVVRNSATLLLGMLDWIVAFGKDRQRIGDRVANTIVVNRRS